MSSKKKIVVAVASCLATGHAWAEENTGATITLTSPVVVTATRIEQNSFDLPVSIDVVDGDLLRDGQQQVNLSETAIRIPGVVVNNRYNLAQDLSVSTRGFGARSSFGVRGVRLYMDGIPLSMPDGQGQTGTFNLDTAKQIEYLRGPFSALYGNSSGGVVQVLTQDGFEDPTLSGGITFGSYNTRRESITYGGQSDEFSYIANAAHFSTDGFRDHSKGTRDTLHGKFTFTPSDDTRITLVATALDQPDTEDPQGLTWDEFKEDPKKASPNAELRNVRLGTRTHVQAGLTWDQKIDDSNSLRLMGYTGRRENLQFLPTSVSGIDREFWGMDARWTYQSMLAGGPFTLSAGLSYDDMEDDRKGYTLLIPSNTQGTLNRDETQSLHSFDQYLQATWEPSERWLMSGGLRHTRVEFKIDDEFDGNGTGNITYENTSPVLGVTFKLTPALNLYANVGKGFETPTFIETTYSDISGNGPNLSLDPSKSWNYEAGIKAFINDFTRVNLALFKVMTEKEIVVANSAFGRTVYTNAGDTERRGLELSLDSALPHNFNFYAAYTLMNAEFKDSFTSNLGLVEDGNRIPGTYTSTTYAELSWKHPASGFSTAVEGIHNSKTYTNDTNTDSADAYTLFNWRGSFSQQHGDWKFNEFVRIENLFDREYISSIRVNDSFGRFYEPGATRNWTLGLNASYQF